jgi:hypothetical protein
MKPVVRPCHGGSSHFLGLYVFRRLKAATGLHSVRSFHSHVSFHSHLGVSQSPFYVRPNVVYSRNVMCKFGLNCLKNCVSKLSRK